MDWLYEKSKDNTNRYILGTVGKKPLLCIGINPSTAEPNNLDPTLQSVARISAANGYDSWIMINVYPQRATDINKLRMQKDYKLHNKNMKFIEDIIKDYKPTIWAAWGTLISSRPYLINCLYDIAEIANKYNSEWINVGKVTKHGHPHHPLYLNKKEQLNSFEIEEYIRQVSATIVFNYINLFKNKSEYNFEDFYKTLDQAEFIDFEYGSHLTTNPINIDIELEKLRGADFSFVKALITAIIREDHFINGAFDERLEKGDVVRVLNKLRSCYNNKQFATL